MRVKLKVEILPHGEGLPLPSYASEGAAGLDLRAAIDGEVVIPPGGWALIPTGIKVAIPEGFEGQVRPRSGLALRHGIALLNAPGTVDSDYRGEIKVILVNLGREPFVIRRGDRIAQLVISPVARAEVEVVREVPPTKRGEGGFGSTGLD
ncbi:MAG TPA: dUTP diphosphatase [Armatimonadetes bacterium]|nr:dUTP diphosphatase [Armatimonadota bacterium]